MLKAVLNYSKKIPVPDSEYSSQGYSLSLETEIPETDPKAIQERIHLTFELVKASVEQELSNGKAKTTPVPEVPENHIDAPRGVDKASPRQVKFVMDLAIQRQISLSELNAHVKELYGVGSIYDLTKRDASKLVDVLKKTPERRKAA